MEASRPAKDLQAEDLFASTGAQIRTVPDLLHARAEASADAPALWHREGAGWATTSWGQYRDSVAAAARALAQLGLGRGERVGIMSTNTPRWDIAQCAAMAAGAVVVGLDPHDDEGRLRRIASLCRLSAVLAEDEATLRRLGPLGALNLRFAATLAGRPAQAGVVAFDELLDSRSDEREVGWNRARASDEALITFTSGTTGEPKGIAYRHEQVCTAAASILRAFPDIAPRSRLACWLPLANLFQRMINLCAVGRGAQIYYVAEPTRIMDEVADISPHLFIGVPRFYEKLYAGLRRGIDDAPPWQRWLAEFALGVAGRQARADRLGGPAGGSRSPLLSLADRLVLRRMRAVLGKDLKYLISGSAPMPSWLLEWFQAIGLPVLEAYGTSECITPIAANRAECFRLGTVGRPLSGVEVDFASDGELLVRSAGVFSGYLDEPGSGPGEGGWLATGDYAQPDSEGFIVLNGRKSEVFKTSTGRRVAPSQIEQSLRRIPYVEHAAVYGANRARPFALVSVSDAALAARLGAPSLPADLLRHAGVIAADVALAIEPLPGYLHPEALVLTTRPFTPGSGELTANLKLRRKAIEDRFRASFDALAALVAQSEPPAALAATDGGPVLLLRL